ncbi:peptidoglycan-binding protein [Bacillus salacetis]|uniref:Peptidoglycan-binding protein n=2 Tax=Bacillus salacetis TaxID=2315464 RepID=A0A3A1RAI1_9BACI|nr:peptidoglycan-binding protein [Bacillus salacetis]
MISSFFCHHCEMSLCYYFLCWFNSRKGGFTMKRTPMLAMITLILLGMHSLSVQAEENINKIEANVDDYHNLAEGDMLWELASKQDEAVLTVETRKELIHKGKEVLVPKQVEAKETEVQGEDNVTKEIEVKATAYTAYCEGCIGITKTGVDLRANPDEKVIAVDPEVIPLGSKVYVEGFGYATAEDTGSAIKGNRIDIFIPSREEALEYGARNITVEIIE